MAGGLRWENGFCVDIFLDRYGVPVVNSLHGYALKVIGAHE